MKVVTFGEIMLRLSTPGFSRFVQASTFEVTFGGVRRTWPFLWRTMDWKVIS